MNLYPQWAVDLSVDAVAAVWHPHRPHLLLCSGHILTVYDNVHIVATLRADDRIDYVLASKSHAFIVALTRSEV